MIQDRSGRLHPSRASRPFLQKPRLNQGYPVSQVKFMGKKLPWPAPLPLYAVWAEVALAAGR
jgi:hypothetical protein